MKFAYFIGGVFSFLYISERFIDRHQPAANYGVHLRENDFLLIVSFIYISACCVGVMGFLGYLDYLDYPKKIYYDETPKIGSHILLLYLLVIGVSCFVAGRNEVKSSYNIHIRDTTFEFILFAIFVMGMVSGTLLLSFFINRLDIAQKLIYDSMTN